MHKIHNSEFKHLQFHLSVPSSTTTAAAANYYYYYYYNLKITLYVQHIPILKAPPPYHLPTPGAVIPLPMAYYSGSIIIMN